MKQKHRLFCAAPLCLALTLAVGPLSTHARAAQTVSVPAALGRIDPRFDYISRISCGMNISDEGYASSTGSYTMYDGMDGTITLTLYRFVNSRWVSYASGSKDFTGDGTKMYTNGWDVPSGYRYRATAKVEILDEDGTVVETVFCDSPVKEY